MQGKDEVSVKLAKSNRAFLRVLIGPEVAVNLNKKTRLKLTHSSELCYLRGVDLG